MLNQTIMKEPIASIITDIHLEELRYDEIVDVVIQAIDETLERGLVNMYIGGDIFNSRKSQTFNVLQAWSEILDYCSKVNIQLIVIPGNHDKLDYTSERSYLDMYASHPCMTLITSYRNHLINRGFRIHLIPFFDEKSTYKNYLNQVDISDDNNKHILLTHIAVNGVRNNDGSKVDESLSKTSFDQFYKVFVGHYHDKQKVGDNIYYIGSIMQRNYGEDQEKGMTILYNDGSHELFKLQFTKYETLKIDLDKITDDKLHKLCSHHSNTSSNIRFKFTGTKQKLDALDKSKYDSLGIDVKCEYKDLNLDVSYKQAVNFSGFDEQKIRDEWTDFSQKNEDIDQKIGINYLEEIL